MGYIAKVYRRFKSVKANEQDPDHIWAFHLAKIMPIFYLWYDAEDWLRISLKTKIIHALLMMTTPLLCCIFAGYLMQNVSQMELSKMSEGVSWTLGGGLTTFSFFLFSRHRQEVTSSIQLIDEKIRKLYSRAERSDEFCGRISRSFVQEGIGLFLVASVGCGMIISSRAIVPLLTTPVAYNPFDRSSFDPIWCLIYLFQLLTVMIAICFYTFKDMLIVTVYIQLSLLYEKIAYDFRHLCAKEHFNMEEELEKLKRIIKEAKELDEIGVKVLKIVGPYVFAYGSISMLMLAISGLSFLVELKFGAVQAFVKNVAFPFYVLAILFIWGSTAERYVDSIVDTGFAAYDCNWFGTTKEFKRLIILTILKTTRIPKIKASYLYVVDMDTLADILKRAYYFLTLLQKVVY